MNKQLPKTKFPIKFILSDLDGVIRKFPQSRDQQIESKFGLPLGTIYSAAFAAPQLNEVVCGRISDELWRSKIIAKISEVHSEKSARSAVQEWSNFPGHLDLSYLQFLNDNFPETPISILTNGTSRLHADLVRLGIKDRFFKIFNSAEIGICKPNPKIYQYVLTELDCQSSDVLFVDDSKSHIQAASDLGFYTHHYFDLPSFAAEIFCHSKI